MPFFSQFPPYIYLKWVGTHRKRGWILVKLKQLEYLLKIVECGSITKAARELYISQPSLTKSIVSLEEEYRIQILIR